MSSSDDRLPGMSRQHIAKGSKTARLGHAVGLSTSNTHVRSQPARPYCWFEFLGNLFWQFALAKIAEGNHLKPFAISQRLHSLERSARGTRINTGRVRRAQELRHLYCIEATLVRKGPSLVRFPACVSMPQQKESTHLPASFSNSAQQRGSAAKLHSGAGFDCCIRLLGTAAFKLIRQFNDLKLVPLGIAERGNHAETLVVRGLDTRGSESLQSGLALWQ